MDKCLNNFYFMLNKYFQGNYKIAIIISLNSNFQICYQQCVLEFVVLKQRKATLIEKRLWSQQAWVIPSSFLPCRVDSLTNSVEAGAEWDSVWKPLVWRISRGQNLMSSDNNGSFKSGSLKDNIVSYSFIFKGKKKTWLLL